MQKLTHHHIKTILAFMTGEGSLPTRDGSPPLAELDLRGIDLRGIDLSRLNLRAVNLSKANLTGATLTGAYLVKANLAGANLVWARLEETNLTWANLARTKLIKTTLVDAVLIGICLTGASLAGANTAGTLIQMTYTGASRSRATVYAARVNNEGRISADGAVRFWTGCQKGVSVDEIIARSHIDHGDTLRGRTYRKLIKALIKTDTLFW